MFSNTLPSKSPSPSLLNCPSNPPSRQPSDPSEADSPKKAGKWTSEEDELLRKYVSMFSEKQWKKISDYIPGRTPIQCLHRWTKILKPGLVKGPWTQDEDQKLLDWIKKHGPGKWAQAATVIPGRSGKQCRERWFNNLNPDVKKGNWSTEEDKLIFDLYQKHGSSWSKISKYIPGRTENSIKNRFYSTLRKLAATKNKEGMGNAGNTGSTGSDVRSNGSNQEELLVKEEDVALKNRDKNEPLLARNSNIKPKVNEKMEKTTAPNEHLQLPGDQQKALQSLLTFLQTPAAEAPMIPLQKPLVLAPQFQVPLINTRINEELKQIPFGQGLLSAPLSFGNRIAIENLDLLSVMFRENANQNKLQFPLQNQPQVPTGGLETFIRSISDDIATASIVYTHGLSSISELLSSNNNSEEAREKVNELFRQVYGLESWLKNAKAEFARLENLVHTQRLFAQLPLEASAMNKRMLFGVNENVEDQQYLVKKRKVE